MFKRTNPAVVWGGHACLLLVTASWIALDPAFEFMDQTIRADGVVASGDITRLLTHFGLLRSLALAIVS
ncbi:MAG: hypothetical protein AAGJ83_10260, partial [Planctomycetota bacterium]